MTDILELLDKTDALVEGNREYLLGAFPAFDAIMQAYPALAAEIRRLSAVEERDAYRGATIEKLTNDNERLKAENTKLKKENSIYHMVAQNIRVEAENKRLQAKCERYQEKRVDALDWLDSITIAIERARRALAEDGEE